MGHIEETKERRLRCRWENNVKGTKWEDENCVAGLRGETL
jgi:hypothetical protein